MIGPLYGSLMPLTLPTALPVDELKLEDGSGGFTLEDGSGTILLEDQE
jgi:hypothetical protein